MSALKIMLKKLFSYTQAALAKRVVACLVLPCVLQQVVEKSNDVFPDHCKSGSNHGLLTIVALCRGLRTSDGCYSVGCGY